MKLLKIINFCQKSSYVVAISTGAVILVGGLVMYKFICCKSGASKRKNKKVALVDPQVKYPFQLVFKEELTHDTRKFRFALPSAEHVLV